MSCLVIPTRSEWREPVILTSIGEPGEKGSAGGYLVARRDHAPRNDRTTGRHS